MSLGEQKQKRKTFSVSFIIILWEIASIFNNVSGKEISFYEYNTREFLMHTKVCICGERERKANIIFSRKSSIQADVWNDANFDSFLFLFLASNKSFAFCTYCLLGYLSQKVVCKQTNIHLLCF